MDNTLPSSRIALLRSVSFLWSTYHEHNVTPKAHRKFYDRLFSFGTTLSKLRDSTLAERLYLTPTDTVSVAGRSLAWKVFLSIYNEIWAFFKKWLSSFNSFFLRKKNLSKHHYHLVLLPSWIQSVTLERHMRLYLRRKHEHLMPSMPGQVRRMLKNYLKVILVAWILTIRLVFTMRSIFQKPSCLYLHIERWYQNPWNEWFVGVEVRKVIAQDVERT